MAGTFMRSVESLLRRRIWFACASIFLAGACARVALLALMHWHPQVEFFEMERIARNLAETGTLGNPYSVPTGPSAHHAPFYPLLLSLIYRGLGYGRGAAVATAAMNMVFACATAALLPLLARAAGLPVSVGVAAGALTAVPAHILKEVCWETAMNGLVLLACTFLAIAWLRKAAPNWTPRSVGMGVLMGFAMIATPPVLCVLLAFAAFIVVASLWRRKIWLCFQAALLLAGAAVGVSPWIARNYIQLGAPAFVRDNYPLEFSLSNHDGVYALAQYNVLVGYPNNAQVMRHPESNPAEARLVRQMGEIAYQHARLQEALRWCSSHKAVFARLTMERFFLFWCTVGSTQVYKSLLIGLLRIAGLWGAVLMLRPWDASRAALFAIVLAYPLPYYLIQIDTRYEYPMDWCMFLFAAYAGYRAMRHYAPRPAGV
jgi:hypothetical protein